MVDLSEVTDSELVIEFLKRQYKAPPGEGGLLLDHEFIDRCFRHDSGHYRVSWHGPVDMGDF